MADIIGSRTLQHSAAEVFAEGTNSIHWESRESSLIAVQPREKIIQLGGIIDIDYSIPTLGGSGECEATVTDCAQDERVVIEGTARNLGDLALFFELEEKKSGLTEVTFGLSVNFNQTGRLQRKIYDASAGPLLGKFINGYADNLVKKIGGAICSNRLDQAA